MAFSHQERWLEYVLSKIAEIKGTGSFDSGLNKRNLVEVDADLDDLLERVATLEQTVEAQGKTIEAQGKTIEEHSQEITRLWDKVNSL